MNFLSGLGSLFQVVSSVARAATSVGAVFASAKAGDRARDTANENANLQRQEANIIRQDAEIETERLALKFKQERAEVSLAFIKGGVTMEGSPLLFLKSQKALDDAVLAAERTSATRKQNLAFRQAGITEDIGEAAFVAGIGQSVGGIGQAAQDIFDLPGDIAQIFRKSKSKSGAPSKFSGFKAKSAGLFFRGTP